MNVREGGSYAADPKTGKLTLTERTELPELVSAEDGADAPEVATQPAAEMPPDPPPPGESARRRGASDKTKE